MDVNENNGNGKSSDPEMIKVVDRKGNVKVIPRAEFEAKKRSRKKHEAQKNLPVKEIISIIFIVAAILAASYFALHLVK
jgi:hypothetical protein